MPNVVNFSFAAGESYTQPFVIYDQGGVNIQDITSWTIHLTIQQYPDALGTMWPITNTFNGAITNAAGGQVSVTFPHSATALFDSRAYYYRLERVDSGAEAVLVYGYIFVSP